MSTPLKSDYLVIKRDKKEDYIHLPPKQSSKDTDLTLYPSDVPAAMDKTCGMFPKRKGGTSSKFHSASNYPSLISLVQRPVLTRNLKPSEHVNSSKHGWLIGTCATTLQRQIVLYKIGNLSTRGGELFSSCWRTYFPWPAVQ